MSEYKIQGSTLTNIANAIRAKLNSSATMTPDEMPTEIGNISSGGGGITPTGTISISENGTFDVTNYAQASVNVSSGGGGSLPANVTKITSGTFTLAEDATEYTLEHNLGVKPNLILITAANFDPSWKNNNLDCVISYALFIPDGNNSNTVCGQFKYILSSSGNIVGGDPSFLFANYTTTTAKIVVGGHKLPSKISDGTSQYTTQWKWVSMQLDM